MVRINEISTTVASAVEEQSAATSEIAGNVQQAAVGTQEVSRNVAGMMTAATEAGSASGQLLDAARGLARDTDRMRREVGAFLTASGRAESRGRYFRNRNSRPTLTRFSPSYSMMSAVA